MASDAAGLRLHRGAARAACSGGAAARQKRQHRPRERPGRGYYAQVGRGRSDEASDAEGGDWRRGMVEMPLVRLRGEME